MTESEKPKQKKLFSLFGCCSREDDSKTEILVPSGQMPPEQKKPEEEIKAFPPTTLTTPYNIRFSYAPKGVVTSQFQPMGGKENSTNVTELRSDTLKPLHPAPVNVMIPQTFQFKTQPVVYRAVQQQPVQFVGNAVQYPQIPQLKFST